MRSQAIQETLDRINPLVLQDECGIEYCPWPYFKRTPKGEIAAGIWAMDVHEECHRWSFPDYEVHKDRENLRHELRLLGRDSPGEYIYSFDSRLIGDDGIEDLGRDIIWWIKGMYVIYNIQSGGKNGKRAL